MDKRTLAQLGFDSYKPTTLPPLEKLLEENRRNNPENKTQEFPPVTEVLRSLKLYVTEKDHLDYNDEQIRQALSHSQDPFDAVYLLDPRYPTILARNMEEVLKPPLVPYLGGIVDMGMEDRIELVKGLLKMISIFKDRGESN